MTATAAGLFLLAASAFRSVRVVFASVSARTSLLGEARRRANRLEKRQRECVFLESAVRATEATLANTETFLAAQRGRADSAEERLEQIAASRQQLDDAAREIRERRRELAEKERELEEERRRAGRDGEVLMKMEVELEKSKDGVEALEKVAEKEKKRLEEEEREQKAKLEEANRETTRLETLLVEKEKQLAREREERDRYMQKHAEAERALEIASGSLERAVTDLEERRKRIEQMEAEAKRVELEAKRKKEGMMAVVKGEVDSGEIEVSMETVQIHRQKCEEAMEKGDEHYKSKLNDINSMKSLLGQRDAELDDLRSRLQTVEKAKSVLSVDETEKADNATIKPESREDSVANLNNVESSPLPGEGSISSEVASNEYSTDIDTESLSVLSSSGVIQIRSDDDVYATKEGTVTGTAVGEANLHVANGQGSEATTALERTHAITQATPVTSEQRQQPKRRRGRPRKNEASTVIEAGSANPKRGRGRPRKVVSDVEVAGDPAPKRKRGRPRKNTLPPVVLQSENSGNATN